MKYILLSCLIFLFACSNSETDKDLEETQSTNSNLETIKDANPQPLIDNSNTVTSDKFGILSNGEKVEEGWSGNDTGNNSCNKCRCMNGNLACTKMACINSKFEKTFANEPTSTKTPILTSTPTNEVTLNLPSPTPSIEISITPNLCSDTEIELTNKWVEALQAAELTKCIRP
ncbi:MAG: hypothetical protein CL772_01990, partial [Chloroflexi bacterium]|nr:hypothetical protein [Chloroflexota bacterium]